MERLPQRREAIRSISTRPRCFTRTPPGRGEGGLHPVGLKPCCIRSLPFCRRLRCAPSSGCDRVMPLRQQCPGLYRDAAGQPAPQVSCAWCGPMPVPERCRDSLLEEKGLRYIVVADFSVRSRTSSAGNLLAAHRLEGVRWPTKSTPAGRLASPASVLLRRRTDAQGRGGARCSWIAPATSTKPCHQPAAEGERGGRLADYNGRPTGKLIKELKAASVVRLCCQKFFATEAALSLRCGLITREAL